MFLLVILVIFIVLFVAMIFLLHNRSNYHDYNGNKKRRSKKKRKKQTLDTFSDQLNSNNYLSYSDQFNNSYNETLKIVNTVLYDNYDTSDSVSYVENVNSTESYDLSETSENTSADETEMSTESNIDYRGDLYQLCPCISNYVCDHGVCKKPSNDRCIISSECAGESICHKGVCTPKSGEWEIPISDNCKAGLTIINNHIASLNEKGTEFTILPGWLSFENSISLCKSNHPQRKKEEILLLTKEELYRVDTRRYIDNIETIKEAKRPFTRVSTNDNLINYNNTIYLLRGSKIYKMRWVNDNSIKWSHIQTKQLDGIELEDGTSLVRTHKKYHIDNNLMKTIIRNSFANRSLQENQIDNLNNLDIGINITGNIIQIVRDPSNNNELICLNTDGTINRYNPQINSVIPIRGMGKKLIVINNRVWLITDHRCVNI